jgi:hypothetical protein
MNTASNATHATLPENRAGSDDEAGGGPIRTAMAVTITVESTCATVLEASDGPG